MASLLKVNCAIFSHLDTHGVLPLIALSEILWARKQEGPIEKGHFMWKGYSLPLITLEGMPAMIEACHKKEKIAVVHGIFSNNFQHPHFFGLYFIGECHRAWLSPGTVKWIDEEKKIVTIRKGSAILTATVLDLFKYSKQIESSATRR